MVLESNGYSVTPMPPRTEYSTQMVTDTSMFRPPTFTFAQDTPVMVLESNGYDVREERL
jgi:hypothetical protein